MDLMYERGRYQECLDLAMDYIASNTGMMFDLYRMATAAAYKCVSPFYLFVVNFHANAERIALS